MAKSQDTESIGLVLENGEQIVITYPTDIAEELLDEIREVQSRDEFWFVGNYTDASAMYKGYSLNFINMKRVIGFS